jgi:hypothetical protein
MSSKKGRISAAFKGYQFTKFFDPIQNGISSSMSVLGRVSQPPTARGAEAGARGEEAVERGAA